jgi:hypothetical protein
MANQVYQNPEPVPPASQLAVLPFLAAVDGYLRADGDVPGLRITIHRAMNREGGGYLQQACEYINGAGLDWSGKVGRTFPVNEGIMGASYGNRRIWRTKHFQSREALLPVLTEDMKNTGDDRDPNTVAISYLAIPFLGEKKEPVLILYADCMFLNFFSDDGRVRYLAAMCNGLCRLFDGLQNRPFSNLRNFPFPRGEPIQGTRTLYVSIQEALNDIEPPYFRSVPSFNFEAAVA